MVSEPLLLKQHKQLSHILILPPILHRQLQQLIKPLNSFFFHLLCIQQFAVVFDEVQHQTLLDAVFFYYYSSNLAIIITS